MWIVVFATAAATIRISTSDSKDDTRHTEVEKGMTKLSYPLKVGGGMKVIMVRDGKPVAECTPVGYRFEARPGVYNFNVFVSMSR
jgi:glucan endo-1,3-alpha-glucosidase